MDRKRDKHMAFGPDTDRLDSRKEVAVHLGRSTRTVQRWEKEEGGLKRSTQHLREARRQDVTG